ncbi:MAG: hypothetical protein AB7P03_06870 [Kofleriaceae bacterium]
MAEMVGSAAPTRLQRQPATRARRRRDDLWIACSALVAAMLALPLAQNSWHSPEVASVLAVSATAMLAGQRWAIALVVLAELLLIPTVLPRVVMADAELAVRITACISIASLIPGVLAMRRAAAAMVLVTGWRRTPETVRRFHLGLLGTAALVVILPML